MKKVNIPVSLTKGNIQKAEIIRIKDRNGEFRIVRINSIIHYDKSFVIFADEINKRREYKVPPQDVYEIITKSEYPEYYI